MFFVFEHEVGYAAFLCVDIPSAQLIHTDILVKDFLHHIGSRNEHVRCFVGHNHKIGHGGRVHRTASGRAKNNAYLRNNSGRTDVVSEDPRVSR
ncbi:hypothetical protein SDC9_171347 [bioreactor metagenome]|uniref:Uncharacterized protein n=1 Tax=bioreactor metagenome TaxID=1076179 RepID=A0A645GJ73_9ZZZZ